MNLFLQIMVFVGAGILTISTNEANSRELPSESNDSIWVDYYNPALGFRWNKLSKQKLGAWIAKLTTVNRAYNFVSPTRETYSADLRGHLNFTAETDLGVFSNVECRLSWSWDDVPLLLLQDCQNNEVRFFNKNIEIPLLEVKLDIKTVKEKKKSIKNVYF